MSRLHRHLDHIRNEVVPQRGAAQSGLDAAYLAAVAERPQPPLLARGLEQWNAGHFYEQHETLEWLWRATDEPVRDLFKGLIQSGVGAFHVARRNRRGALAKWTGALGYLAPFVGAAPYAITVAPLWESVADARAALLADEAATQWPAHVARAQALHIPWAVRLAEPRVTALLRRMDQGWDEGPHGVARSVAGVSEHEADWRPSPAAPSIRTLLHELGSGKVAAAQICFDAHPRDGAALALPVGWAALLRWLGATQEALREGLGFLHDAALAAPRPTASDSRSREAILDATIERDLHHAGQIGLLRTLFSRHQESQNNL